jgi:hypothetical protein
VKKYQQRVDQHTQRFAVPFAFSVKSCEIIPHAAVHALN